ncbi:small nuclear ribonucleoprotein-associated protein B, putative [Plasmodium berghei]|uniref:Sm protein B n=2 Tax=Plasmodium berghei TaxID=5821 RepID=A0A509AK07_PLABA|nr:small nuclear ribonucleoprotein-associated protein B, putative [Plasmodium berghei ANKA]CXI54618.1 small nuclear ribonucleoprotein-associated protein B, putative [Plasmodium berghei]SCL95009.1 small nuclear ribonucleoprotein-associated protein B, putative [Plasmodium berghei]SCM16154.1 small nuclear ribonucleoprotein-associated protein B, putative [Plasmodium berghei]SCM17950.1 small nuclear ribonucleoprotein-associated protein B, putative [Plasmodium berghei]SCN26320.1 small nuclear ribonu|eukprot:XP_034422078.1 small nuclear ribonucleoprotein-associated protein B, putative [Plasmodium berghei ANKA]
MGKNYRLESWLQYRVRVTISDTRYYVGTFLSYDRHMNIVLVDAEEFRRVKNKENNFKEIKRVVGLILIRGDNIVSFTAERAPINKKTMNNITNKGIATGRGIALNNYVPMQNNMTPNMPTGVGINVGTSKNLTPIVNPGFKSPNIPMNNKMPFMPMGMQINPNVGASNNAQMGLPNQIPTQLPFPPNSKPPTDQ